MTPSPISCRRPRVLAVVTLFCPPPGVVDNLMTYVPHADGLYIWDNTPGGARITWPAAIADRIVCHRVGTNVGIARALNAARRLALDEGYDLLLTMDQDSRFAADTFAAYLAEAVRRSMSAEDAGALAFVPRINRQAEAGAEAVEQKNFIVSGTLFAAQALQAAGPFDERLVIDAIDTDYALRLRRAGGHVWQLPQASLEHSLGQPLTRRILCFHPCTLNYSPLRTFYIVRNHLYLRRAYREFRRPDLLRTLVWKRPLYILLMEPQKGARLRAWWRGVWRGLRGDLSRDPYLLRGEPEPPAPEHMG